MIREALKTTIIICKGVDKKGHNMANITLNLCCDGLQEVREVQCLETILAEDEIAYRESVKDVGPSMIISSSYTYYDDIGPPQTYMNISYPTSN